MPLTLDSRRRSPFQHGAQDDFDSSKHPNVRSFTEGERLIDRFAVFNLGQASDVCRAAELKTVDDRLLGPGHWPYDDAGRHVSARG